MAVGDQFNIHILAILSAVAATLAKQIIFYVSYGGGRIISEKTRKRMKPFERLVKKYGAGAAFVATLTGKIVLSYVIVLTSHFVGISLLDPLVENIKDTSTIYIGMIVFGASLTVMIILLLRLDWARILGRFAPWTLIEEDKKD